MGFSSICVGTVTITRTQQAPRPLEVTRVHDYSWPPCVSLMVDKMVDVDVPLTMNWRAVNISKHKAQGCY